MIILFLTGGVLASVCVVLLFTKFLGFEIFSKKEVLILSLSVLFILYTFGFSSIPQLQYFFVGILLLFTAIIKKRVEDVGSVVFLSFFSVLISSFVNYLEQTTVHIILNSFYDSSLVVSCLNILLLLINIFVIYSVPSYKFEKLHDFFCFNKYLKYFIMLVWLLLLIFSILTTTSNPNRVLKQMFLDNNGIIYLFFSVGIFTLVLFIHFGIYLHEKEKSKVMLTSLSNYNNEIERLNEELMMFRHDYLNLLRTLKIAIDDKNIAEVEKVYLHVLAPTEKYLKNSEKEVAALSKIKNIEIKSLISLKLNQAKNKQIKYYFSIYDPIYFSQSIDIETLVRMIGILLDNAIENGFGIKAPYLELSLISQDKCTRIIIINSFDMERFSSKQFVHRRYTTKKDNSKHGLGLNYIKQVVKNNACFDLETTVHDNNFKQELIVKSPF